MAIQKFLTIFILRSKFNRASSALKQLKCSKKQNTALPKDISAKLF